MSPFRTLSVTERTTSGVAVPDHIVAPQTRGIGVHAGTGALP